MTAMSQRIREARRRAGLTQQQLADQLAVTRSAVAQWEGRAGVLPTQRNLMALADALNVGYEWLAMGHSLPQPAVGEEPAIYGDPLPEEVERLVRHFNAWPKEKRRALLKLLEEE